MGAGAGATDWVSQGAVRAVVAGDAGDVVDLVSALAEWAIEDSIGVDGIVGGILLDPLVDVNEERARRSLGRIDEGNFHKSSTSSPFVVGTVAATRCDCVIAHSCDVLRSHEDCSA